MNSYAYYNGRFDKREEIFIPLSDRSIFFGDAVYDAMIGSYDRIMWEDEHIDRLLENAEKIGIKHSYTKRFLSDLLREIGVRSMIDTYLLYVQISRDYSSRRHSAVGCSANLLVTVEPITIEKHPKPMKLITFPDKRYGYCDVKTVNLLPAVLSATVAENEAYDEAVFIKDGTVTECTKSNISVLKQGRLITHPKTEHILPGIVRAHLLEACKHLGIPFEERKFTKQDLLSADEILVTSTTKLCKTVNHIDNCPTGSKDPQKAKLLCDFLYSEFEKNCKI